MKIYMHKKSLFQAIFRHFWHKNSILSNVKSIKDKELLTKAFIMNLNCYCASGYTDAVATLN